MLKKCKLVMLASNQKAITNQLFISDNKQLYNCLKGIDCRFDAQHLYILSDEDIKEGDWVECNKQIYQHNSRAYSTAEKKIIATTDTSLLSNKVLRYREGNLGEATDYLPLPQPSQSFIEKYIEKYNKGKRITGVMVEYEGFECSNGHYMNHQTVCNYPHCEQNNYPKFKVSSKDNTITIKPVKDSWNRDEVDSLIESAYELGYRDRDADIGYGSNLSYAKENK